VTYKNRLRIFFLSDMIWRVIENRNLLEVKYEIFIRFMKKMTLV